MIKNKLIYYKIFLIISVVLFVFSIIFQFETTLYSTTAVVGDKNCYRIGDEKIIYYFSTDKNFSRIKYTIGTYGQTKIEGNYEIELLKNKKSIFKETVDTTKIRDNQSISHGFKKIMSKKEDKYELIIKPNKNIKDKICIWSYSDDNNTNKISGTSNNAIDLSILISEKNTFVIWYTASLMLFFIFVYILKKEDCDYEKKNTNK